MAGSSTNDSPIAFINAPAREVISRLVGIIRSLRPDIVLTFEPNGGYGHPDHIAIHQHTIAAFHVAADADQFPDQGDPWQAKRLYYMAIPRSFFVEMRKRLIELGEDVSEFERFEQDGGGWPDDQVDVTLDVSDWIERKWMALNCHQTQFGPNNLFRRLPEHDAKRMMSREYFALAWPESDRDLTATDLFAGLGNLKFGI